MDLPDSLRLALSHELANVSQKQVAEAASNLSLRYRSGQPINNGSFLHSHADVQAYAAVRLPATFAALYAVLSAVRVRKMTWQPHTMLDAGAGPGTAMWAASELWTELEQVKLLEREEAMIAFGKQLTSHARSSALQHAQWQKVDLLSQWSNAPCDLVITSYVLGELDARKCAAYIAKLWSITEDTLVIIEPGTPVGFSHIRSVRQQLIAAGAHILAPCPHAFACPMTDGDWCHFAQRITRTQLHRSVKQADLSYEDEKFSYIAVSRTPGTSIESRVIRHPQIRPGHIHLELCTPAGLKNAVVTRKDKAMFRQARDLHWGDALHTVDD
jgi:ribosomal protein RSM22 (predicted rRNA methylase)